MKRNPRLPTTNDRGETIVEVVVAFVLLLLFIALFQSAIGFSRSMMNRANQTRSELYAAEAELHQGGGAVDLRVRAQDLDEASRETRRFVFLQADGDLPVSLSVEAVRGTMTAGGRPWHAYAPAEGTP